MIVILSIKLHLLTIKSLLNINEISALPWNDSNKQKNHQFIINLNVAFILFSFFPLFY